MKKNWTQIIKGFIITVATIQILMMIVYLFYSFYQGLSSNSIMNKYNETTEYIKAANTGNFYKYTGILYPMIIRLFQFLETKSVAFFILLYLFQLVIGYGSIYYILGVIFEGKGKVEKCFFSLYLMSLPLATQWFVTVLPQSLAVSVTLCILGLLWKDNKSKYRYIHIGIGFFILGILDIDFLWIMLIVFFMKIIFLRSSNRENGKKLLVLLATILLFTMMGLVTDTLFQQHENGDKIQNTLAVTMLQRIVYPHYLDDYNFFDVNVKEIISEDEALKLSKRREALFFNGSEIFKEAYDTGNANDIYWSMVFVSFERRTKETIVAIGKDTASYIFAPIAVYENFCGNGESLSGWNYSRMLETQPELTKVYMYYGFLTWSILFLINLITIAYLFINKIKLTLFYRGLQTGAVIVIVSALYFAIFQETSFDYKNAIIINLFWGIMNLQCLKAISDIKKGRE